MQNAYVMLEWCTPAMTGSEVVLAAVTANPSAIDESVHPLSGLATSCDGVEECEVHFTVGLVDGDGALTAFCDTVRSKGIRVKSAMIIPPTLARASVREVWDFQDQHFAELAERLDADEAA
jgi:hypothetical protein